MEGFLQTDHLNVYVGYSFSDDYDINPIFKKMYQNPKQKMAFHIVCHHRHFDKRLFKKLNGIFGNKYIENYESDTYLFLKRILSLYTNEPVPANFQRKKKEWDLEFRNASNISYNFKLFTSLDLLNKLKIDIYKIDKNLESEFKNNREHIDVNALNILNYELCTISEEYYKHNEKTVKDNKSFIISRFRFSTSSIKKTVKYLNLLTLDDVQRNMEDKPKITYEETVSIAYYHKKILDGILSNTTLDPITCSTFFHVVQKLESLELKKIPGMNVYASALRYSIIVKAILGQDYEEKYLEALSIYYDFGNLEGVISTIIEKIVADKVLFSMKCKDNELLQKAKDICHVIGSYRYLQNINYLETIM